MEQHNGLKSGGAKKTIKNRPWKLILYVSGFPYERTAMQYEFCIQRTKKYKRTSGIANKIYLMKAFLNQDKICSTAPLNSGFKTMIVFSEKKFYEMWNSLKIQKIK